MKQKRIKKRIVMLLTIFVILGIIVTTYLFTDKNIFSYSNLFDNDSQNIARSLLEQSGIPHENIELFFEGVDEFYKDPYPDIVKSGFQEKLIPFFSYRDTDAFQHLEAQENNTLVCRMVAFILLKDTLGFGDTSLPPAEEKDGNSRRWVTKTDLQHYDLLFSNIEDHQINSSEEMIRALTEYWDAAGVSFPKSGDAKLIMAYGSDGTLIQNFHTAVVIQSDSKIWLLEKYNPIYPYQLSCLDNETKLIDYMKLRIKEAKYSAVFLENICLWSS